jgi:tetratricopeptide (TPR) repeat protein
MNLCLNVRGAAYRELGDFTRSAEMLTEVESRWKSTLPAGHIVFAALASQKSLLSFARGDARAALPQAEQAVALAEAIPEARDRITIFLLRRANIQMQLLQMDQAQADAARALALLIEATGPGTFSCFSGRAYLTLGRALSAQGQTNEARAAYVSAVEHLEPTLGKDHSETLEAARALQNQ